MHESLISLESECSERVVADSYNLFYIIMGKHPEGLSFQAMVDIWLISGYCISNMHRIIYESSNSVPGGGGM